MFYLPVVLRLITTTITRKIGTFNDRNNVSHPAQFLSFPSQYIDSFSLQNYCVNFPNATFSSGPGGGDTPYNGLILVGCARKGSRSV